MPSVTNTNPQSIAAFKSMEPEIPVILDQLEYILEQFPEGLTGAETLALISDEKGVNKTNVWTRLGDAQRDRGSIIMTEETRESSTSHRMGAVYKFVPQGPGRVAAQLKYWQDKMERDTEAGKRLAGIIAENEKQIEKYTALAAA